jgi:rSAM/selenodomain-associated transferase 2
MISVIIPVLNEEEHIAGCIKALKDEVFDCEIIITDGGSTDRTAEVAASFQGVKVICTEKGRGNQMNTGAASASGEILLFLHADTILEKGWAAEILSLFENDAVSAGAFTFSIQSQEWKYRLIEAWVKLRCTLCSLPYGDQAIFVGKSAFDKIGGYKNIPLMEDVDLIIRLKKLGPINILDKKAVTSERRWKKKGLIRTMAMNQLIMLLYIFGVDPFRLARIYYR